MAHIVLIIMSLLFWILLLLLQILTHNLCQEEYGDDEQNSDVWPGIELSTHDLNECNKQLAIIPLIIYKKHSSSSSSSSIADTATVTEDNYSRVKSCVCSSDTAAVTEDNDSRVKHCECSCDIADVTEDNDSRVKHCECSCDIADVTEDNGRRVQNCECSGDAAEVNEDNGTRVQNCECSCDAVEVTEDNYGTRVQNCVGSITSNVDNDSEEKVCVICLDEIEEGETVRSLPKCKHMFHQKCIDPWFIKMSSFCPVCRTRVIKREVEPQSFHWININV